MTRSPQNGRPAQELNERFDAIRDAMPVRTSCAFCGWAFDGTALQGREHAAEHRASVHPELRPARRRRSNIRNWMPSDDGFRAGGIQRAAEKAAMFAKRATEAA